MASSVGDLPGIQNEPLLNYGHGSLERAQLKAELDAMRAQCSSFRVPIVIDGSEIDSGVHEVQVIGCAHQETLCRYAQADKQLMNQAIEGALRVKSVWESMPFQDRAAIFLKAADLLSTKYRFKIMAATMLGQGKNVWQAEIDAAAELIDFWRFNCQYALDIYRQQPTHHAKGVWNTTEYRSLEGFILAVSPFNFTAIGGNLCSAPALMGNVVIWKPAPAAVFSNYLVYNILREAGLPDGVIQFVPGPAEELVQECLNHADLAGLHFTGSTFVFKKLWKMIANNLDIYKSYPRIVGETGGKNIHFVHESADPRQVVLQTVRSAFEYQGQKCSACSRLYVPDNLWPTIRQGLIEETGRIRVGPVDDFTNFMTNVINRASFDKIKSYIQFARQAKDAEIIVGGKCEDSIGFFVHPTIILTTNPHFKTMEEEIFGPVLTVLVYPENEYEKYLELADKTSPYALTCSLFASDRKAIIEGQIQLRHTAGNFYINDKCTGAVVGQQSFGGSRASGTNDKAGASMNLYRWISARSIKENFLPLQNFTYPSNVAETQ